MEDDSIMDDDVSPIIEDDDIMDESIGAEEDIIELSIIDEEDMSIAEDEEASCESAPVASRADRAVVAMSRRNILVSLGSTRVERAARRKTWLGCCAARFRAGNVKRGRAFPLLRRS